MKKLLSIILASILVFSATACSGSGTKKLLLATSPDYPPYESYDESGKLVGFDIDALTEIVKIMNEGKTKYEIEWKDMSFDTIISAVQTSQVDIGVSCFTYDPERDVLFSSPYLKSAQVVVVLASSDIATPDDLKGKKIGAGDGTTGESAALEIEGAEVTSVGDYLIMFETLKNGGLDAIVCDEAVGQNYAKQAEFKVLEEKLVDENVSVIFKKDNSALADEINKAIEKFVASEAYAELKTKHGLN